MKEQVVLDNDKYEKAKKNSRFKEICGRLVRNKSAMLGMVILAVLALIAIFADVIVPSEMATFQDTSARLQPPSWKHYFGTDRLGRDVFARVVHGSRVSLSIGFFTSLLSLAVGGTIGAAAGYYGGKFDEIVMRIMDVLMTIPPMLLCLTIVASLGPSMINLLIAMAISAIPGKARLIRSTVLNVVSQDYIEAAKLHGASDARIIFKYIIPNALGPIIVDTTMGIGGTILGAASLSYIGMGIQPPAPEWGSMLSDAKEFMRKAPYLLYFPGVSILLSVMSFNLFGDGLRDAFDPKLKD